MARDEGLRTLAEAAEWLGVSESWLEKKVARRAVPHTRPAGSRAVRFSQGDLDEIVADGKQPVVSAPHRATLVAIRAGSYAAKDPRPPTQPPKPPKPPAGPPSPKPPAGPKVPKTESERAA